MNGIFKKELHKNRYELSTERNSFSKEVNKILYISQFVGETNGTWFARKNVM